MAKNENQKLIMDILRTRPIAFNASIAHALGSAKAGLFLSQLLFWCDKGSDPDWIYKTIDEVKWETALSRKEQDTAIKICKKYDLIKVKLKGIPAKRHFKVDMEKIIELLRNYYDSLPEKDKQVCPKRANKIVDNGQRNSESTSDINDIDSILQNGQIEDLPDFPFLKNGKELAEAYKNGDRTSKPFFRGDRMGWNKSHQKWVVHKNGEWLDFALKEKDIEWR